MVWAGTGAGAGTGEGAAGEPLARVGSFEPLGRGAAGESGASPFGSLSLVESDAVSVSVSVDGDEGRSHVSSEMVSLEREGGEDIVLAVMTAGPECCSETTSARIHPIREVDEDQ